MRQDDKQLRMGDKVLWRGGFGHQRLMATVTGTAITESAPEARRIRCHCGLDSGSCQSGGL